MSKVVVAVVVVVVLVVVAVSAGCNCNIKFYGSGGTTYSSWWDFLVTAVTVMPHKHISYLH